MEEVALEETVPGVVERRGGRKRAKIPLETLREEGSSFLSLGEDPLMKRLEMVRLWRQGYSFGAIGEAFGYSPQGVWAVVQRFEEEGVEGLIEKRGGPYHSKVTPELEREILRYKALHPQVGDTELAAQFGLGRITIYNLLKEHGLQDLHRVIEAPQEEGEKKTPSS
jgi:transposase